MGKPLLAIVGRPNVGKSTLFNRLVGRRTAIVTEVPGTTRDRVTAETSWGDRPFILVDTGGLEPFPETEMWQKVKAQVDMALEEADVIVMTVDCLDGVTPADRDVADALRRRGKPVILAANKADNRSREESASEFYELGLGDPTPVSAYHNVGIDDLMARVISCFPSPTEAAEEAAAMKLAIVGRTNVGKSMLLNTILGQERAIVSDVPGTTRDAVDSLLQHDGESILLIDTAGIRRRGRIEVGIERYSILRAIRAIDRADVVLLVTDASELTTAQDTHIASYILEAFKGMVLTVNKWDLAPALGLSEAEAVQEMRQRFKFAPYTPVRLVSALHHRGIESLLATAREVYQEWTKHIPRGQLNRTVMSAVAEHPPAQSGRRSLKIYRASQEGTSPPAFTFYVNRSSLVHFSYQRYLENTIRKAYGFTGSPLKMVFKGRGEE